MHGLGVGAKSKVTLVAQLHWLKSLHGVMKLGILLFTISYAYQHKLDNYIRLFENAREMATTTMAALFPKLSSILIDFSALIRAISRRNLLTLFAGTGEDALFCRESPYTIHLFLERPSCRQIRVSPWHLWLITRICKKYVDLSCLTLTPPLSISLYLSNLFTKVQWTTYIGYIMHTSCQ